MHKHASFGLRLDGPKRTSHAKLIIIDGKIVVIGSTNLSHYGIDMNGEANVIIHDEKVATYFEGYFEGIWEKAEPSTTTSAPPA